MQKPRMSSDPIARTMGMQESEQHHVVSLNINSVLVQTTRKLACYHTFPWPGSIATVCLRSAVITGCSKGAVRDRRKFKLVIGTQLIYLGQDSKEYKKKGNTGKYHQIFQLTNANAVRVCRTDCKCPKRRTDVSADCVTVDDYYTTHGPYPLVNLGWSHRLTHPGKQDVPFDVPMVCLDIHGHYLWIDAMFVDSFNLHTKDGNLNGRLHNRFVMGCHCKCQTPIANTPVKLVRRGETLSPYSADNFAGKSSVVMCVRCNQAILPLNVISSMDYVHGEDDSNQTLNESSPILHQQLFTDSFNFNTDGFGADKIKLESLPSLSSALLSVQPQTQTLSGKTLQSQSIQSPFQPIPSISQSFQSQPTQTQSLQSFQPIQSFHSQAIQPLQSIQSQTLQSLQSLPSFPPIQLHSQSNQSQSIPNISSFGLPLQMQANQKLPSISLLPQPQTLAQPQTARTQTQSQSYINTSNPMQMPYLFVSPSVSYLTSLFYPSLTHSFTENESALSSPHRQSPTSLFDENTPEAISPIFGAKDNTASSFVSNNVNANNKNKVGSNNTSNTNYYNNIDNTNNSNTKSALHTSVDIPPLHNTHTLMKPPKNTTKDSHPSSPLTTKDSLNLFPSSSQQQNTSHQHSPQHNTLNPQSSSNQKKTSHRQKSQKNQSTPNQNPLSQNTDSQSSPQQNTANKYSTKGSTESTQTGPLTLPLMTRSTNLDALLACI